LRAVQPDGGVQRGALSRPETNSMRDVQMTFDNVEELVWL
jgi:hypothetical protein